MVSACVFIVNCVFVCIIGLMNESPFGFQRREFLGAYPSGGSLKTWGGRYEVQTLASQATTYGFLLDYVKGMGFIITVCLILSYAFSIWLFSWLSDV